MLKKSIAITFGKDCIYVKEYFKLFEIFILAECIPINDILARILFINGLNNKNKKDITLPWSIPIFMS